MACYQPLFLGATVASYVFAPALVHTSTLDLLSLQHIFDTKSILFLTTRRYGTYNGHSLSFKLFGRGAFSCCPSAPKSGNLGENGKRGREMEVAFCSSGAHFARSTAPEGKIMHNHCMQHFAHEVDTLVPQCLKISF